MKQLKKNDFLMAVTEEPMTRGELVEALDEFEFIDSWLTYLTDHFESLGRIIVERDDDDNVLTVCRKAKKGAASRDVFWVSQDEEGNYAMNKRTLEAKEVMDKDAGERTTASAAIKAATSAIFADYKERTAAVKALADSE